MSGGGAASYLPVESSFAQQPAPTSSQSPNMGGQDPLRAALLGGKIGEPLPASLEYDNMPLNTLDEPVSETLVPRTYARHVYLFLTSFTGDLWGPLVNSLILAISLGAGSAVTVAAFSTLFTLIWLGAAAITVNARLLGYRFPLLPTIAYLGYCLTPLAGIILLLVILPVWFLLRFLLVGVAAAWGAIGALQLLEIEPALEDRRLLAAFPFTLYFTLLAWIIIIVI